MQTVSVRTEDATNKWVIIDAEGRRGRPSRLLRCQAAARETPRGLHPARRSGRPHRDHQCWQGRADRPQDDPQAVSPPHGHPGGIKTTTPQKISASKFPERVLELAVKRMMPGESPLARKQFAKLRVYGGADHPHTAQNPKSWTSRNEHQERESRLIMAEAVESLDSIKDLGVEASAPKAPAQAKIDKQGRASGTGRRKTATARV